MRPIELKRTLEERLSHPDWQFSYNPNEDKLKIEHKSLKKAIALSLQKMIAKYKDAEMLINETVSYVQIAMNTITEPISLDGNEKNIFPVIRSTSFPIITNGGNELIFEEHTAETRIYYAINKQHSYTLITQEMLANNNYSQEKVKEVALFNLRSLTNNTKNDYVANNKFYFINEKDGYDASRILNDALLKKFKADIKGDMVVAVPHQDVMIIADIQNEQGYDILAQMVFQFYTQGSVPITALPFIYEEGNLEPIFILAQKKPVTE